MSEKFAGDKKVGKSILTNAENSFKFWLVPKIPKWIETYHLTLTTIIWSAFNFWIAFYTKSNLNFLWLVSLMIVLQYVTDLLDGELGRQRNTGLIKWGFYMDHFLDFIFLGSLVFVGYMISPIGLEIWYVLLLIILVAFMASSFLSFASTNQFEIYYYGFGPTEIRVFFILINIYIIIFKTTYFYILVPLSVLITFLILVINVYIVHKKLWKIDMDNLKKSK